MLQKSHINHQRHSGPFPKEYNHKGPKKIIEHLDNRYKILQYDKIGIQRKTSNAILFNIYPFLLKPLSRMFPNVLLYLDKNVPLMEVQLHLNLLLEFLTLFQIESN